MATLRQTERTTVDDAVGPCEPPCLKLPNQVAHRLTLFEVEHEGNVLEQQPPGTAALEGVDQAKDVTNQPGVLPIDAGGPTGLAEILTRKSCSQQVNLADRLQLSHVARQRDVGKPSGQDSTCPWIVFTQQLRAVTRSSEPLLDTTDSGEESGHGESVTLPIGRVNRHFEIRE